MTKSDFSSLGFDFKSFAGLYVSVCVIKYHAINMDRIRKLKSFSFPGRLAKRNITLVVCPSRCTSIDSTIRTISLLSAWLSQTHWPNLAHFTVVMTESWIPYIAVSDLTANPHMKYVSDYCLNHIHQWFRLDQTWLVRIVDWRLNHKWNGQFLTEWVTHLVTSNNIMTRDNHISHWWLINFIWN